jgi:hypothetical protein
MIRRCPSSSGALLRCVVLSCVVLAGASACLSPRPVPPRAYYNLALQGEPAAVLPGPTRLEPLAVDPAYASARLARRTSAYRLEYYSFHRWAADPGQAVTAAARDYLARGPAPGDGEPLQISGTVRRLEERVSPAGQSGVIAIDLLVRRAGRVVLEGLYQESEPSAASESAKADSPEATVAALSRALARLLDRLAADLAGLEAPAR